MSTDSHDDLILKTEHYIGIDVGTGSARACIINGKGDIVGLASESIGLWQPESGFYVSSVDCLLQHSPILHRNNPPQIYGVAFAIPSEQL